ncbi:MAG TPA: tetratricopeptide repeat protein [Trueperaceae bacterium]
MFLRTLGGARLEGVRLTRPKSLLLLAYLAVEGPQKRRNLAELFWPQASNYLRSLNVALAQVRSVTPSAVGADRYEVWTELESDVGQLLVAIEGGDLEAALALYGGPFLDGLGSRGLGTELEEWIFDTRERLALTLKGALLARSTALTTSSPDVASRLLAIAGQMGATFLDSIPHNLVPRADSFVGRAAELAHLDRLLHSSETRLVTLVGPGGAGKTRLAEEAAARVLARGAFRDGVLLVPVEAVPDATALPARLANHLGVTPPRGQEAFERLCANLRDRKMLVVLDNFEHLIDAGPQLTALLTCCPNLHLLVTSRERLNLTAEVIVPLAGLPHSLAPGIGSGNGAREDSRSASRGSASGTQSGTAAGGDAVELFLTRASQVTPGFEADPASLQLVTRICRLVGGLPLALELAASWLRVLPLDQIASALALAPETLTSPLRDIPERHRSFHDVFDGTWRLLDDAERITALRLSILADTWGLDAAWEVAGASGAHLRRLVDKSVVQPREAGRFTFHPLVRGFLAERLSEEGDEADGVRERHARHYLSLIENLVGSRMFEADHRAALDTLEAELSNVVAAWHWVLQRNALSTAHLPAIAFGLQEFFDRRGRYAEGSDFFRRSQDVLRAQLDVRSEATEVAGDCERLENVLGNVLVNGAYLDLRLGRLEQAERKAMEGLETLAHGDMWGTITGHYALGLIALESRELRRAEELLERSLALARQIDSPFGRAGVNSLLRTLAKVHVARGKPDPARRLFEEALERSRRQENEINVVRVLIDLASLHRSEGDNDRAQLLVQESLDRAERAVLRDQLPRGQLLLAELNLERGDLREGRKLLSAVLSSAQEFRDPQLDARAAELLGAIEG